MVQLVMHIILQPCPEGEGGSRAMQAALDDAGIVKKKMFNILMHMAQVHPVGDMYEIRAIKNTFEMLLIN